MEWSSWFRRSLSGRNSTASKNPNQQEEKEKVEELLGITQQLIDHVKSFTVDTFKSFPLPEEEGATGTTFNDEIASATTSTNIQKDLSEWQERHATHVLSKVKELAQLRFVLCPRHLKERQFWRIYFTLVKSHVAEYELRAIQLDKLKRMAMENEKYSDANAFEVEMAETKQAASLADPTP